LPGLEFSTLKNQSLLARAACGLLLAATTLALAGCSQNLYKFPAVNFAGRPIPPSNLANRVLVAIDNAGLGTSGQLEILDANRDIRNNVENTIFGFFISYASPLPTTITSFPEQGFGYVYSAGDGSYTRVNYNTESPVGPVAGLPPSSDSVTTISSALQIYSASSASAAVVVVDNSTGRSFPLNLPGAQHIFTNTGGTVALVTTRNTNNLYRIVKLSNNVLPPSGTYTDCEPLTLPVYCVVPVNNVPGNAATNNVVFDRPIGAVFSLDGSIAYVLNCGPECGGTNSGITALNTGVLTENTIPLLTSPSPVVAYPGLPNGKLNVPGGVTVGLTDGNNLYVAGQELLTGGNTAAGLFSGLAPAIGHYTGVFSTISLTAATPVVTSAYRIPDGTHSSMLFADDNTLWIGSTLCSNGANGFLAASLPAGTINLNCLAAFTLGGTAPPVVVPAVSPSSPVLYPNQNNNQYYYGDLTGICWVQNLHKVYTAYGGQIHAFYTNNLSEINNGMITVQGTATNVVYMDALTNAAN
jgi:hypothetical protein